MVFLRAAEWPTAAHHPQANPSRQDTLMSYNANLDFDLYPQQGTDFDLDGDLDTDAVKYRPTGRPRRVADAPHNPYTPSQEPSNDDD
jgi:hypothetical protein